ncbi:MAG: DUF1643 domain-containing protein [Treponema sp.]|nr:DUF1643 domain-containing protein [Treponema sp.]
MTFYGDIDDDAVKRFKFELKGTNELIILGSKPGDARAKPDGSDWTDDSTIDRIIAFAMRGWNSPLGFDGFLLINISPSKDFDTNLIHENLEKIKTYLDGKNGISVLLAYGDIESDMKESLNTILSEMKNHNAKFYRLGKPTEKGYPRQIYPRKFSNLPITETLHII